MGAAAGILRKNMAQSLVVAGAGTGSMNWGCDAAVVVCGIMLDQAPGYGSCGYPPLPRIEYMLPQPLFCGYLVIVFVNLGMLGVAAGHLAGGGEKRN
jgi:hypothetical protein